MAEAQAKVVGMVERALKKDPELTSRVLFQRAVKIDEAVGQQSVRQFHARYVIPVRRRLSPGKSTTRSARTKGGRASRRTRSGETAPPITEMIEAQIEAMRADLNGAAGEATERVLKSGQLSGIDKLGRVLRKATRELANV